VHGGITVAPGHRDERARDDSAQANPSFFIPHTNPTPSTGCTTRLFAILIGGYAVAFVGLWRTSTHFRAAGVAALTWVCLRAIAILLATPYNRGAFLNWTHMIAGVLGALFQLEVALQLVREGRSFRTVI
jgi:hypothetical protein